MSVYQAKQDNRFSGSALFPSNWLGVIDTYIAKLKDSADKRLTSHPKARPTLKRSNGQTKKRKERRRRDREELSPKTQQFLIDLRSHIGDSLFRKFMHALHDVTEDINKRVARDLISDFIEDVGREIHWDRSESEERSRDRERWNDRNGYGSDAEQFYENHSNNSHNYGNKKQFIGPMPPNKAEQIAIMNAGIDSSMGTTQKETPNEVIEETPKEGTSQMSLDK